VTLSLPSLSRCRVCRSDTMLLAATTSAVVIKRKPECGNDELRGDDDGKEVTGLVGRLAFRVGHEIRYRPCAARGG
jgi:hypothetical protein